MEKIKCCIVVKKRTSLLRIGSNNTNQALAFFLHLYRNPLFVFMFRKEKSPSTCGNRCEIFMLIVSPKRELMKKLWRLAWTVLCQMYKKLSATWIVSCGKVWCTMRREKLTCDECVTWCQQMFTLFWRRCKKSAVTFVSFFGEGVKLVNNEKFCV